jgi:peptidoglycan hydrolase-like protein with peptidoglycan-binding domain
MAEFEHNSEKYGYVSLDDLEGVQNALIKLGYDPGTADGKDGPKTQGAVKSFQTDVNIQVDGIAGPNTKTAMITQLDVIAAIPPEPAA